MLKIFSCSFSIISRVYSIIESKIEIYNNHNGIYHRVRNGMTHKKILDKLFLEKDKIKEIYYSNEYLTLFFEREKFYIRLLYLII